MHRGRRLLHSVGPVWGARIESGERRGEGIGFIGRIQNISHQHSCEGRFTSMKRDDALRQTQQGIRKLTSEQKGEAKQVRFVTTIETSLTKNVRESCDPEFEFDGWSFHTKTGLWENEAIDDGDATVIAPDGTAFGFVWTAGAALKHEFDFSRSFGPMLYVEVPSSVRSWEDLRQQLLPLVPQLDRELKSRAQP